MRELTRADPDVPTFRLKLASFFPDEAKDDANVFLLFNPTKIALVRATTTAVNTKCFRAGINTFSGFRAVKLFNPETRETRNILWPSFCWPHGHVVSAAKDALPKFEALEKETRFNFDQGQSFSPSMLTTIEEWMKKERTAPLSMRATGEDA